MKTYHVVDSTGLPLAGYQTGHRVEVGDELVPIGELDDPAGRHSNCPTCIEELAQRRGGSTRRPQPPAESEWTP